MNRPIIATLLVAGALFAGPAPAAAEPIQLNSAVVVEAAVVRLGDLFRGLGEKAGTAVARAPEPGARVELDARWLAHLARGYGLAWRPQSWLDRVVVERASQVIDARQFESPLVAALTDRGLEGDISLVLDNPGQRLHLPVDADPSLRLAGFAYDPGSGRFRAQLVAPSEGIPLAEANVNGRAIQMTEVPVLGRRVAPGEVIGRDDIEWLRVRADRLGRNVIAEPGAMIGKSPRRSVRVGQLVRVGDLQNPVLVPKNGLVIIRLETGRMILTAQGRALENGASGEVVRVMNTKSNTIINAVVAAAGNVRVAPAATAPAN